jgi:hypothetical protein
MRTSDFFRQGTIDSDTALPKISRVGTTRWSARAMLESANKDSRRERQDADTQHEQRRSGSMNIYAERGKGQGGESTVNSGDGTKQDPANRGYREGAAARSQPQDGVPNQVFTGSSSG